MNGGSLKIRMPMQSGLVDDPAVAAKWPSDDLHCGVIDDLNYDDGIRRAVALGMIKFVGEPTCGKERDFFSHRSQRSNSVLDLRPSNTRSLCPEAIVLLQGLSRRKRPRVLELGPGAGVAAAEIRDRLPECRLETVSLTPIDPFLWLRSRKPNDPRGLSIDRRPDPYIDLQYVGHIDQALPTKKNQFDMIYDCFGAFFWEIASAVRNNCFQKAEYLSQAILHLLRPGGIFFVAASDGQLWTESLMKHNSGRNDKLILLPPRYYATQIRICIFEKGYE